MQEWLGNDKPAEEWSWKLKDGELYPVETTALPAPAELLENIACNRAKNCDSAACSCRKLGDFFTLMICIGEIK